MVYTRGHSTFTVQLATTGNHCFVAKTAKVCFTQLFFKFFLSAKLRTGQVISTMPRTLQHLGSRVTQVCQTHYNSAGICSASTGIV